MAGFLFITKKDGSKEKIKFNTLKEARAFQDEIAKRKNIPYEDIIEEGF